MNSKKTKGISLLVLIITIVIVLIIAGAIILSLSSNNPIGTARLAKIVSNIGAIEDALSFERLDVMSNTYQNATISDLINRDIVEQMQLKNKAGNTYTYNAISIEDLDIKADMGTNVRAKTELKDIFVLDVNDHVIYVDDNEKLYDHDTCDLTTELIGPVYTEDTLPEGAIPIYTVDQYTKIATGEIGYEIKNLSNESKGIFDMTDDAHYVLMNDLNFAKVKNLTPIHNFKGEFEGNRYLVENIKMDTTDLIYIDPETEDELPQNGGLFDLVLNAKISNLTINKMQINGPGAVGALIGESTGAEITSCRVINSTVINDLNYSAGGLIGYLREGSAKIVNSKVLDVNISGDVTAGLIGMSHGDIIVESCRVQKLEGTYAGLIGVTSGVLDISNSKVVENSTLSGLVYVAGNKTTINNCEASYLKADNSGFIYCNNDELVVTNSKVINSTINGYSSDYHASGLVSIVEGKAIFDKCQVSNTSIISNDGIQSLAGFAGVVNADIIVTNSKVNNVNLTGANYNSAGIAAIVTGNAFVENTVVENLNIDGTLYELGSGIIGILNEGGIFNKVKVSNLTINGNGMKSGLVTVSQNDTIVNNFNLSDFKINIGKDSYRSNETAGVVAIQSGDFTATYCFINNMTVANKVGMFGGITAVATNYYDPIYKIDISQCIINNINVENASGETAGVAAILDAENINIANNNISKIKLNSSYLVSGIITVCNSDNINISNSNMTSSKLYSEGDSASVVVYMAGLDRWSDTPPAGQIERCNINTVDVKSSNTFASGIAAISKIDIKNCNVYNSNIIFDNKNDHYSSYAAGIVTCTGKDVLLENNYVSNTKINGDSEMAAGIVAISVDTDIKNCHVKNVTLNSNSFIGGILATTDQSSYNINELSNCSVKDVILTNIPSPNSYGGNISGGIAGNANNLLLKDSSVENITLTSEYFVGGIAGIISTDTPGQTNMINCTIKDSTLTNTVSNDQNIEHGCYFTGGITGVSSGSSIDKTYVHNVTLSGSEFVGGIAGIIGYTSDMELNITNSNVDKSTIKNVRSDYHENDIFFTGGIVSNSSSLFISKCNVTNSTIETNNSHTGGISGLGYKFDTCVVNNTNITDSNTTSNAQSDDAVQYVGLGGIVGHGENFRINSLITNCKVIQSTLKGCDTVGGISGVASPNISKSEVSDTTITGTGKYVGGIQGFGGLLISENALALKISDSIVKNSKLYGSDYVGQIVGRGTYYHPDSLVPISKRLSDVITNTSHLNTTIN